MNHVSSAVLDAYLDDALSSDERTIVAAHLAQCATCRTALGEQANLFVALADPTLDELPVDLRPAVIAALTPMLFDRRAWMLLALQAILASAMALWLMVAGRLVLLTAVNDGLTQIWRWLELVRVMSIGDRIADWAAALPTLLAAFAPDLLADFTLMQWVGWVALAVVFWLAGNRALLREQNSRGQQEVRS